jgi:hypothetical protein
MGQFDKRIAPFFICATQLFPQECKSFPRHCRRGYPVFRLKVAEISGNLKVISAISRF